MAFGLVIAKDSYDITGNYDELYVDPRTRLNKVVINAYGAFSTNGSTWTSKGPYAWREVAANSGGQRNFLLDVQLPQLDYIPQFCAYMDQSNNKNRTLLSNYIAGVGAEGDTSAFVSGGLLNKKIPTITINMVFTLPNQLTAGEYGYFMQIYYDRVTRPPS